jgi:hypothetical protein
MKNERKIMSLGIIIIIGFAMQAAGQYKNVALNPGDVRAPGHGYPHASSNSEYPCIYPADTTNGNHCVPDTTFLALSAINGDTLNTSHGSLAYASWGPQLTVPGLWWKIDFGHDVTIDKVKIWVRADWSGGHDSYWKRATLVFTNGTRDTITIDSLKTGQESHFTSRNTQSITVTDFIASNPAKWCAFTEVQVWGYDPPTAVSSPVPFARTARVRNGRLFCLIPGVSPRAMQLPADAAGAELYSVQGKRICTIRRGNNANTSSLPLPSGLSKGIYQIKYF